jgi:intracellular septation protein A
MAVAEMVMQARQENDPMAPRRAMQGMLPTIAINGVLPFVLYRFLTGQGVATVPALCAGAIFPVASIAVEWVRTRRLAFISAVSLAFIAVSVATSLISGDARFTLLKESAFTGLTGLLFLGSLFTKRPIMFFAGRQFTTNGDPERMAAWDGYWQFAGFRHTMRLMTTVWGVAYLIEALVRVCLVFVLSTSAFLIVSQVLVYGVTAALIGWTMRFGRRTQQQATMRTQRVE